MSDPQAERVVENGVASRSASRRLRVPGRAVGSAVLAVVVVATGVMVGLNPSTVRSQAVGSPGELLEDASFDLAATLSAWQPVPGSASNAYRTVAGGGTVDGSGHGVVRGTIRQDVPLPPVDGRSYRAVVAVRGNGGEGVLRVQTACASAEERAETRFTPTGEWRDVSATLTPVNGAACSLRVEVASLNGSPIAIDRGSFGDAGLANPSFEQGGTGWGAAGGATLATAADGGAFDGGAVARLTSATAGGSLVQDVELDRSSEPILATARVAVRSPSGPATVELELRPPCSDRVVTTTATVDAAWTPIVVSMLRTPAATPGGVPPDAPELIRPTGDPCSVGVAVVLRSPGSIEIDGAALSLRSYNSASGSPAYKARLGTGRSSGDDDATVDTTIAGDNTPDVVDRDASRRSG